MSPENFAYWLRGFFELNEAAVAGPVGLTHAQVAMVQRHLSLVFDKKTAPAACPPARPPYSPGVSIPYVGPRLAELIATC